MSIDLGTLEKRLTALEAAVADIQRKLAMNATAPNWIEQISGIVKDKEVFEQAMAYGRAWREAQGFPEDSEEAAP
jgi:hypothetical protein